MKCPYREELETHIQRWVQLTPEDGDSTKCTTVEQWLHEWADCLKEECAAWQNGHCCYNGK